MTMITPSSMQNPNQTCFSQPCCDVTNNPGPACPGCYSREGGGGSKFSLITLSCRKATDGNWWVCGCRTILGAMGLKRKRSGGGRSPKRQRRGPRMSLVGHREGCAETLLCRAWLWLRLTYSLMTLACCSENLGFPALVVLGGAWCGGGVLGPGPCMRFVVPCFVVLGGGSQLSSRRPVFPPRSTSWRCPTIIDEWLNTAKVHFRFPRQR